MHQDFAALCFLILKPKIRATYSLAIIFLYAFLLPFSLAYTYLVAIYDNQSLFEIVRPVGGPSTTHGLILGLVSETNIEERRTDSRLNVW
jgi:hypothetical protein